MDIETKNINGNLEPYCICIFDGKNSYSFYITDFTSSEEMVKSALKFLMKRKYNRSIVYLHNFSYFDGIFLFGSLLKIIDNPTTNIKPLMRNGRIINLKVIYLTEKKGNKKIKYYINFRDSYLLLTASLSKLGKTFNKNKKNGEKGFFPFNFVNEPNVGYDYIGNVPDIKYFNGMDQETYKMYIKQFLNKINYLNK
jgi:DNA polymerase type B, organellar and viral